MSVVNKLENSKVEVIVTVDPQEWKNAQEKAFKKLAADLKLKGFRAGKVPTEIAKQHIKTNSILLEAVDSLANNLLQKAIEEHNLQPVNTAELGLDNLSEEECSLKFTIEVYPEVTIHKYKDLGIVKEEVNVTDEEVEKEFERVISMQANLETKEDGIVENGDTAVIDFEGFLDGVAFEGGKGENYPLEIGSGSFIPGFEEQLIGLKAGDEKDITVTFPENYHAENLKGKETVFKVKVHEVKTKKLPEMDEEFFKEIHGYGEVKNAEELKAKIKERLVSGKEETANEKYVNEVLAEIRENSEYSIPKSMIDKETDNMMADFKQRVEAQGMKFDMYLGFMQKTEEELKAEMRVEAEKRVETRVLLEKIAELEKFEISDEEVVAELAKIAASYNMDVEEIKKYIAFEDVKNHLKVQKAFELISK